MNRQPLTHGDTTPAWGARARGAGLCAFPTVAGGGGGTTSEFLPLAIVLAAFTGAAVWVFRRWGPGHGTEAPERAPSPARLPLRDPAAET